MKKYLPRILGVSYKMGLQHVNKVLTLKAPSLPIQSQAAVAGKLLGG